MTINSDHQINAEIGNMKKGSITQTNNRSKIKLK